MRERAQSMSYTSTRNDRWKPIKANPNPNRTKRNTPEKITRKTRKPQTALQRDTFCFPLLYAPVLQNRYHILLSMSVPVKANSPAINVFGFVSPTLIVVEENCRVQCKACRADSLLAERSLLSAGALLGVMRDYCSMQRYCNTNTAAGGVALVRRAVELYYSVFSKWHSTTRLAFGREVGRRPSGVTQD